MKNAKKILSVIIALVITFTVFPMTSFAASKPSKPKVTATSSTTSVKLKWKKTSYTTGYVVYKYNTSTKKSTKLKTTTKLYYTNSKLTSGKTYTYYVKAYKKYKKSGKTKTVYGSASSKVSISTKPGSVKNFAKSSATYNSITVKWSKVTNATAYRIAYSTSSSMSSPKYLYVSGTSKTVTGLVANKTYYFKIRAYRTYNKTKYYGADSSVLAINASDKVNITKISTSTTYQKMLGFGSSACWWQKTIGGWDNSADIMKLLYSSTDGIGLNIYRYNLGAGSDKDDTMIPWNRAESFLTDEGTLDFSKDANSRECLRIANSYCPDLRVTLFCNSAPYQYTINGKTYIDYGSPSKTTNLATANYANFANYVLDCADYFSNEGYNITDVSPINEPEWSWESYSNGTVKQEGCHYEPSDCLKLFNEFLNQMESRNIDDKYVLSIYDSGQIANDNNRFSEYISAFTNGNTKTANYMKNVNNEVVAHSYWVDTAGKKTATETLKLRGISSYRMTEYCQMIGGTSGLDISYGVELANTIYEDLTILNAKEWDWWVAVATGGYCDGLVYVDTNTHAITIPKRFYCLGNFSKFIEEGAVRVDATTQTSGLKTCSFKNTDGSLVVVYINDTSSSKVNYINCSGYSTYSTYLTDATHNLSNTKNGTYSLYNGISIPANSVVSVVLK